MISVRLDPLETKEANVSKAARGEAIITKFEIVPLDTNVIDFVTPTLYLTQSHFIVSYDEILEIYNFGELDIEYLGEVPKFSIVQQFLEGKFYYFADKREDLDKMRAFEELPRMAVTEPNQVPKDFTLRKGFEVQKAYQVWAMTRMIKNYQRNQSSEGMLQEMVDGNFTRFNQKTILAFVVIFVIYLLIRLFLYPIMPDVVNSALNFFFGAVVLALGVWLWLTVSKNLEKFKALYNGYAGLGKLSTPDSKYVRPPTT
ncbi:MAG: hypothetical protein QY318_00510 [Candidatus Dojkabacteria bacterium]|nr:MAG: hypothetical protein QY318_00510 [Candidatus Dojkabacteria bacterium]